MANPNFLSANSSGLERMQAGDQAYGYDVNRIVSALTGINLVPISIGDLTVTGNQTITGALTVHSLTGPLVISSPGITPFTGNANAGILKLKDSNPTVDNFMALDFGTSSQTWPVGRIATKYTSGGTEFHFGVSNNYSLGITLDALTISPAGAVVAADNISSLNNGVTTSGSAGAFFFADRTGTAPTSWALYASGGLGRLWNVTTGDIITFTAAGDIHLIGSATQKLVPGATSFSLRNNADNADNLILTDAGLGTMRNALSIPPSAGGTVSATSYGTVLVKITEVFLGSAGTITLSSIPGGFRSLLVVLEARGTNASTNETVLIQINSDTGSNYDTQNVQGSNATVTAGQQIAGTSIQAFVIPGNTSTANVAGGTVIFFPNYSGTTFHKRLLALDGSWDTEASGGGRMRMLQGNWRSTSAITTILFKGSATANLATGSNAVLYGIP